MSLSRSRTNRITSEICADCSKPDASWASINRGVLLCSDCCSVHRTLGRHTSQVKSLAKGAWEPNQLAMIYTLASRGANNIWEHALLDPKMSAKTRRKPNPSDLLYPTKAEFIRAKYQNLSYMVRTASASKPEDLNRQLHSCVRTTSIETTLRLLAHGAYSNYFDSEKGSSCIHIAAREGQSLQVELLAIYGADPALPDFEGRTAADYAKAEGHHSLAERLTEMQFEVTDRLSHYLCGKLPNHRGGQHFLIPEVADGEVGRSVNSLQGLSSQMLEKLVHDVYDEVDRRETEAAWLASQSHSHVASDRNVVLFLPVNPHLSAMRNQSRQKMAKINARDFATMIIDVLCEVRRRSGGGSTIVISSPWSFPTERSAPEGTTFALNKGAAQRGASATSNPCKSDSSGSSQPVIRSASGDPSAVTKPVPAGDQDNIDDIPDYDQVPSENGGESSGGEQDQSAIRPVAVEPSLSPQTVRDQAGQQEGRRSFSVPDFPEEAATPNTLNHSILSSMMQKRLSQIELTVDILVRSHDSLRQNFCDLQLDMKTLVKENAALREALAAATVHSHTNNSVTAVPPLRNTPMNSINGRYISDDAPSVVDMGGGRAHKHHNGIPSQLSAAPAQVAAIDSNKSPTQFANEQVIECTEQLTQQIRDLYESAQNGQYETFAAHAADIQKTVDLMIQALTADHLSSDTYARFRNRRDSVEECVNNMVDAAIRLTVQCSKSPRDSEREQHACHVAQVAYDVAKSAKQLIAVLQQSGG